MPLSWPSQSTCRPSAAAVVVLQVAMLGKSLGGAVAIYLAAARQATMQAVIVENTFTSLEEVAPKVSLCCLAHS